MKPSPIAVQINRGAAEWSWFAKPALYTLGALPGVFTFYLGLMDQLGADPMRELERTLGLWALRFLVASLCITPLRDLAGVNLIRYRRALGLLSFFYALAHLTTYLVLDQGLYLSAIWADILKRPYITIGMLAFLVLLPLAITSNSAMVRRLGGVAWAQLHRLVYAAAALAAAHFLLVVKAWPLEPMVYAAIVAALLLYRLYKYLKPRRPYATAS